MISEGEWLWGPPFGNGNRLRLFHVLVLESHCSPSSLLPSLATALLVHAVGVVTITPGTPYKVTLAHIKTTRVLVHDLLIYQ